MTRSTGQRPTGRTTPTQKQVLALHRGEDRGGKGRNWSEVAALLGFSHSYVTRIAYGKRYKPNPRPLVVIDPRDYESDLAHLSDEEVQKWQAQPYCLCGCGQATEQEHSKQGRVPLGAYRMFLRAHWSRLPRYKAVWIEGNRDPGRKELIWEGVKRKRMRADDVSEMLWRWKNAEPGRTMAQLAHLAHMSTGHVQALGQRHEYVRLDTAARLYAAMGEPMTREMYREFKRWAGRRTLRTPDPIVQR